MTASGRPPALTVETGDQVYLLSPGRAPATIGRASDADVRVQDPRVGLVQVRLDLSGDTWRAIDADSRTGMFVRGERRTDVDIKAGLTIHIGAPDGTPVGFEFTDDPGDDDEQVDSAIARAGAAVAARRRELDITQRTLAKYRIMNAGALITFEKGRSWPRERTRARLEEVLQWPPGTIANIRNGGAVPGERSAAEPADEQAPLILGAVDVAMKTFGAAIDALPGPSSADFAERAAVILSDLRQLEIVVARAARQSRGIPAIVMALSNVRTLYADLMIRAAAAPDATLGQRLFATRRRANLSAAETGDAIGLSAELIEAVESGHPATNTDAASIEGFLAQFN